MSRLIVRGPDGQRETVRSERPSRIRSAPRYAVTGDFQRMIYSRHHTRLAAERACRALAAKWGPSHPGSEPRVIEVES